MTAMKAIIHSADVTMLYDAVSWNWLSDTRKTLWRLVEILGAFGESDEMCHLTLEKQQRLKEISRDWTWSKFHSCCHTPTWNYTPRCATSHSIWGHGCSFAQDSRYFSGCWFGGCFASGWTHTGHSLDGGVSGNHHLDTTIFRKHSARARAHKLLGLLEDVRRVLT